MHTFVWISILVLYIKLNSRFVFTNLLWFVKFGRSSLELSINLHFQCQFPFQDRSIVNTSIWLTWATDNIFLYFKFYDKKISSVENQKGVIADQRCSIENQKGAIAIDVECCVAEPRHTNPRLERDAAAIPGRDGPCYGIRVPDPAVHSLVPEPYLLRTGLDGRLQGWPAGFQGFVSAWSVQHDFFVLSMLPDHLMLQNCFL